MKYSSLILLFALSMFVLVPHVDASFSPRDASFSPQDAEKNSAEQDADKENSDENSDENETEKNQTEEDKEKSADASNDDADPGDSRRRRRTNANDLIIRNGESMRNLFEDVTKRAAKSTVIVRSGKRQVALGTVVDENGFVLTKKSELKGSIICEMPDGTEYPATVYGVHEPTDLALLKIESRKLKPIEWNTEAPIVAGSWLITANNEGKAESLGIISVAPRVIKGGHGFMGIMMDTTYPGPGALITSITPNSPAEKARFKGDDVIIKVEGNDIADSEALREAVSSKSPGESVKMTIKRGANTINLKIVLGSNLDTINPQMQRSNFQNNMGGLLSERRYNFPLAIQHDSVLRPRQCGGPVVNLDGDAVGLNIARNGRVASFALPVSVILPVIEELKSGKLAPAVVNKAKIEEINKRLNDIEITLSTDPLSSKDMETELVDLKKTEEASDKAVQDALKKAKAASNATAKMEAELKIIKDRLKKAKTEKDQLEREREKLVTGAG